MFEHCLNMCLLFSIIVSAFPTLPTRVNSGLISSSRDHSWKTRGTIYNAGIKVGLATWKGRVFGLSFSPYFSFVNTCEAKPWLREKEDNKGPGLEPSRQGGSSGIPGCSGIWLEGSKKERHIGSKGEPGTDCT